MIYLVVIVGSVFVVPVLAVLGSALGGWIAGRLPAGWRDDLPSRLDAVLDPRADRE